MPQAERAQYFKFPSYSNVNPDLFFPPKNIPCPKKEVATLIDLAGPTVGTMGVTRTAFIGNMMSKKNYKKVNRASYAPVACAIKYIKHMLQVVCKEVGNY